MMKAENEEKVMMLESMQGAKEGEEFSWEELPEAVCICAVQVSEGNGKDSRPKLRVVVNEDNVLMKLLRRADGFTPEEEDEEALALLLSLLASCRN